jgi:hypothetical protein
MARDWEGEFQVLVKREREAFFRMREALDKISLNTPPAVWDEKKRVDDAWDAARKAVDDFMAEYRRSRGIQ